MKVLVTGAGGFIGSHVVEALINNGHEVIALVRYTSAGKAGLLEEVYGDVEGVNLVDLGRYLKIIKGDVRNQDDVYRAVEGVDVIIHMAAQIAIPWSYVSPREFTSTNIGGTLNILMAAKKLKIKRIIHISTSEIYGSCQVDQQMDEFHPQVCQSPYAASKISADKLCQSFFHSFETPVVIVRPFNTYGSRQSNRAVIPSIILQAISAKTRIALGSLDAARDFNFVKDTAANICNIALAEGGHGQEYNLCSGESWKLREIVEKVGIIVGANLISYVEAKRVRPKHSEVMKLCGDGSKANEKFGLPKRTDIMTGLRETIQYYRTHKKEERFTL